MNNDLRLPIVAGNWKMNGTQTSAAALADGIVEGFGDVRNCKVVICPPFILIPEVARRLSGTSVHLGGQDLDIHGSGAYTGQTSAAMLTDQGCDYCIVGHSERRTHYGESDELVAEKFRVAQEAGMTPILCIGETLEERESGDTEKVLSRQVDAVVRNNGIEGFANSVLAYEPVWAIGTGMTASPEQAQDVHAFLRSKLSVMDKGIARKLPIQYGGSVKADNAGDLFGQDDIDGGLIGGASLKADTFLAICRAA